MHVRSLVLGTLASGLAGCPSTWNCHPPSQAFSVDEGLTAERLDAIVQDWGVASAEELSCEAVCRAVELERTGWEAGEIEACNLELSTTDSGVGATSGHVTCSGVEYEYLCKGRRPLGEVAPETWDDGLPGYLAAATRLEAMAVTAFRQLAHQLAAWGAPEALIARCELAARQEGVHAAGMGSLARRYGAELRPSRCELGEDDLLQVALNNAVEGCVRESWAALLAGWISARAHDADLREAHAALVDDEISHGQLAWDLHAWLLTRLSAAEREQVEVTLREALADLPALAARQARGLPPALGLPTPEQASALAERFARGLAA